MQADEDFNIRFVTIVKRHRCLYDKKVPEYRNKDFQEKAWQDISKDTKESVLHCKERWRNLRACLSRYIKQQSSSDPQHKPYYLSEHMAYLVPFLKSSRQPSICGNSSSATSSYVNSCGSNFERYSMPGAVKQSTSDLEDDFKYDFSTMKNKEASDTESTDSINFAPDVQIETQGSCEIVFPSAPGEDGSPQNAKRIKTEGAGGSMEFGVDVANSAENADMEFFKSILPDIRGMTALQRRKFKIGILELIDDVYDKYPAEQGGSSFHWRK